MRAPTSPKEGLGEGGIPRLTSRHEGASVVEGRL